MKRIVIIAAIAAACMTAQAAETNTVQAIVEVTYDQEATITTFLDAQKIGSSLDSPDVRLSEWAHAVVTQALKEQIQQYNAKLLEQSVEAYKLTLTKSTPSITIAE